MSRDSNDWDDIPVVLMSSGAGASDHGSDDNGTWLLQRQSGAHSKSWAPCTAGDGAIILETHPGGKTLRHSS